MFSYIAVYLLDRTVVRMWGNCSSQKYLLSFLPSYSWVCLYRVITDF